MRNELLTPQEMAATDRRAIAAGPLSGMELMRNAGAAVAAVALRRFPHAPRIHVLCGPGNNGGDGYVAASRLAEAGADVSVWALADPAPATDAATARAECPLVAKPLNDFACGRDELVVDALFGAGLARPLEGAALAAVATVRAAGAPCLAVDLPSGISGASGAVLGDAFDADATVTFVRRKPGHLLLPGARHCGEVVVADIGIADAVVAVAGATCFENGRELWSGSLPDLAVDAYKYSRGHVAVVSGGEAATGAARLAAMAAARIGAGAVTMLTPPDALLANAAHLTSVILRKVTSLDDFRGFMDERKPRALVFGPGLGPALETGRLLIALMPLACRAEATVVVDADGLTSAARQVEAFLQAAGGPDAPRLVLTPHEGEFRRLFPELSGDAHLSKLDRARRAAAATGATVVYKGPDTVIAAADGRAAISGNGTPLLATAGSGDVLSGMIAGLVAQGMAPFEAACAAVWIHAEAARGFGPGLMAEDLPMAMLPVLRALGTAGRPPR